MAAGADGIGYDRLYHFAVAGVWNFPALVKTRRKEASPHHHLSPACQPSHMRPSAR